MQISPHCSDFWEVVEILLERIFPKPHKLHWTLLCFLVCDISPWQKKSEKNKRKNKNSNKTQWLRFGEQVDLLSFLWIATLRKVAEFMTAEITRAETERNGPKLLKAKMYITLCITKGHFVCFTWLESGEVKFQWKKFGRNI